MQKNDHLAMSLMEVEWHADCDKAFVEAFRKLDHVPACVIVNMLASKLALYVPLAIEEGRSVPKQYDVLSEEAEAGRKEAFSRIMDAVFSMEDFDARKAPWRLQSTKAKRHQKDGWTVRQVNKPVGGTPN